MKRLILLNVSLFLTLLLFAQAPSGYYTRANGKTGSALKTALCTIITAGHTAIGYDNLWTAYRTTDVRPDGKLWDMYSDITNYDPSKPSGNYHEEGDVPNREHSFPKSWWGGSKNDAYSDIFHVVPADGYVNNRRSNYPFGETSSPTYTSHGGFSKLGPCDAAIGYSGTVFEPNDEYKGDFARIYFYMCTRYENEFASWSSPMLAGNKYPGYTDWAITMLLRWAAEDPVSQKEIDRNNAIFKLQGNRNPYVDFPGLEQYVWGTKKTQSVDLNNYDGAIQGGNTDQPTAPVFSPESGEIEAGTVVTITSPEGYTISFSVNGSALQTGASPVTLTLRNNATITAFCTDANGNTSVRSTAEYTITTSTEPEPEPQQSEGVFALISSTSQLEEGANYLVVWESGPVVMGAANGKVRSYIDIVLDDHTLDIATLSEAPTILRLEKVDGYYAFYIPAEGAYLGLTSDANNLGTVDNAATQDAQWTITFEGTNATITHRHFSTRAINYNASSPRFATYKSTSRQRPVQLYREQGNATGLRTTPLLQPNAAAPIYTLDGRRVKQGTPLKSGVYIQGGRKFIVR